MAVVIEAFTIIVRNSTLEAKYPGGREAFAVECPNRTYCNDGNLSRVAFMHYADAQGFISELVNKGLVPSAENNAEDVAVVSPTNGLHARGCDWLVFATYKGVPVAWADGATPTPIVGPPGYELDRVAEYMTADEASRHLEYLRTQEAIDVYRDRRTGQEVYVARTGKD